MNSDIGNLIEPFIESHMGKAPLSTSFDRLGLSFFHGKYGQMFESLRRHIGVKLSQ